MEDPRIIDHYLYPEYARLRIRERELLREGEERRREAIELEDLTAYQTKCLVEMKNNLADADLRFAIARKKLDQIERKLREDMGLKNCP